MFEFLFRNKKKKAAPESGPDNAPAAAGERASSRKILPTPGTVFLLLNRSSQYLARGELQGEFTASNMQFKIIDGQTDDVVAAEIVEAVPRSPDEAIHVGRVILRRGNTVVLESLRELGSEVRKNLRMPVDFESFVYPREGGRVPIKSVDLSCGGLAFYSSYPFQVHDDFEVVIPITEEAPLLLNAEVLRVSPYNPPVNLYATAFINLLNEEEAMVRESVFNIQIDTVKKKK